MGRKTKLTKAIIRKIELLAGLGLTETEIANILDISRATIFNWKKNKEFSEALEKGKIKADLKVISSLYEKAVNGDTTAMIFWLKNRRPDEWRDKREMELREQSTTIIFNTKIPDFDGGER